MANQQHPYGNAPTDCYQPPSRWSTALFLMGLFIIAAGLLYLALVVAGSR